MPSLPPAKGTAEEGGRGGSYNPERVSSGRESFAFPCFSLVSWPRETADGSRAFANGWHPVISGDSAWLGHSAGLGLSLAGNPEFGKVGHCAHRCKLVRQLILSLGKEKSWALEIIVCSVVLESGCDFTDVILKL